MAKADVLQLVQDLSYTQADPTTSERYYRDVVYDLGRRPWLTQITLIDATGGTASYTLPATAVRMLGVFYDIAQLSVAPLRELEVVDPDWRSRRGTPVVFVVEDESEQSFRLHPAPDADSEDFIFLLGSPLGLNFPARAAGVIHTEIRNDLPAWLELPVAFEVLEREFQRDSRHRDPAFAAACGQLARTMYALLA